MAQPAPQETKLGALLTDWSANNDPKKILESRSRPEEGGKIPRSKTLTYLVRQWMLKNLKVGETITSTEICSRLGLTEHKDRANISVFLLSCMKSGGLQFNGKKQLFVNGSPTNSSVYKVTDPKRYAGSPTQSRRVKETPKNEWTPPTRETAPELPWDGDKTEEKVAAANAVIAETLEEPQIKELNPEPELVTMIIPAVQAPLAAQAPLAVPAEVWTPPKPEEPAATPSLSERVQALAIDLEVLSDRVLGIAADVEAETVRRPTMESFETTELLQELLRRQQPKV